VRGRQVANFLQKLEVFRAWGWKDMMALSLSVQVLRFRRGDVLFQQVLKKWLEPRTEKWLKPTEKWLKPRP